MEKKRRIHKRILAAVMAVAMVVSIFAPVSKRSINTVFADDARPVTVDGNGLVVSLAINGVDADNPDIVYEGDSLSLSLKFNIPAGDLQNGTTYVYDIPDNIVYTGNDTSGSISIPASSALHGNTETAGTYTIDKENGKVYFYVTDTTVLEYNTGTGSQSGKDPIQIPIVFDCNAEASLGNTQSGSEMNIPGYTGKVVIFNSKNDMGMTVSKTMSSAPDADGYIDCSITVAVPSDKASSYSTIDVTDTFLKFDNRDILSYAGNLVVTKVDAENKETVVPDSSYSVSAVSEVVSGEKSDGVFTVTGLPQLLSNEKYIITYKLKSELVSGDKYAYNSAKADSTITVENDGKTKTSTDTQSDTKYIGLSMNLTSKNGTPDLSNGRINYTITFNGKHSDINGLTLRDIIDFPDSEGAISDVLDRITLTSIKTIDTNGDEVENSLITESNFKNLFTDSKTTGGIEVSSEDKNTYIIQYTYTPVSIYSDTAQNFNNLAYVDDSNQDDGNVTIGALNPQGKGHGNVSSEGTKTVFPWTITIKNPFENGTSQNVAVPAGSYTVDTFGNGQYIDGPLSVSNEYIDSVQYLKADGTYTTFDEAKDSDGKVYGFKAIYKEIPSGTNFSFTYNTYKDTADIVPNEAVTYTNTAIYNYKYNDKDITDTDTDSIYYTKTTAVYKYVMTDPENFYSKTDNPSEKSYSDADNKIYYLIHIPHNESTTATTVIDELPEGTSFGDTYGVYSEAYGGKYTDYDISSYISEDISESGKVKYTIQKNVFKYSPDQYNTYDRGVFIIYYVTIPEEKPDTADESGVATFTNKVTYNGDEDSVTQAVSYGNSQPVTHDVLQKSNEDPEEVQNSQEVYRTFKIIINQDEKDIDPSSDYVTLNDTVEFKLNQVNNIELTNIHLYQYDSTAEGYKGKLRDSSMTFSDERNYQNSKYSYKFSLVIPDSSAFVLEYTYKITRTNLSDNNVINYSNSVNLNGNNQKSSNYSFEVSSSSASSTVSNPEVTMYKVDSNNYNIKLTGATFTLSRAMDNGSGSYEWEEVVSSFTVPGNGVAIMALDTGNDTYDPDNNKLSLTSKTVYKLQEKTAPEDYNINNSPIYFVIGNDMKLSDLVGDAGVSAAVSNLNLGDVKYFVSNSTLDIGNQEKAGANSISIKKKWLDNDGNEISTSALDGYSATVDLIKAKATPTGEYHTVTIKHQGYDSTLDSENPEIYSAYYVKDGGSFNSNVYFSNTTNSNGYYKINGVDKDISDIQYINYRTVYVIDISDVTQDYTYEFYNGHWSIVNEVTVNNIDTADLTFEDVSTVGTYVLDSSNDFGKKISIDGSVDEDNYPYYYYIKEKSVVPNSDYSVEYSVVNSKGYVYESTSGNKYSTSGGTLSVSNKASSDSTGDVTISKKVEFSADSSVASGYSTKAFQVELTLSDTSDNNTYNVVITNAVGINTTDTITFAGGKATVNILDGCTVTIKDLPQGVTVSAEETLAGVTGARNAFENYALIESGTTKSVASGSATVASQASSIDLKNIYSQLGMITVNKKLQKNGTIVSADSTSVFKFGISATENGEIIETKEVTLTEGEGTVIFNDLPLGTYYVYEMNGDAKVESSYGKYTVTNSGTSVTLNKTEPDASVEIINNELTGTVSVTKKFVSPNGLSDTFYFTLFEVSSDTETQYGEVKSTGLIAGSSSGSTKTVSWTDVPYGTYKVYETDADGNKLTASSKYVISSTLGLSVTLDSTSKDAGTITNTEITGALKLSKTVVGDGAPSGTSFEFEITVAGAKGNYAYTKTSSGSETATNGNVLFDNDGKASVSLSHGESIEITGLPVGAAYKIIETTTSVNVEGGVITYKEKSNDTGEIAVTAPQVSFTNQFTPAEYTGKFTVEGTKAVTGAPSGEALPAFGFTLKEVADADGTAITESNNPITATASNNANGDIKFEDVSVGVLDFGTGTTITKYFKLTEDDLSDALAQKYTKDSNSIIITVTFTKPSGSEGAVITGTVTPGKTAVKFTNTRLTGSLKVEKGLVSTVATDAGVEFTFAITVNNGSEVVTGDYPAVDSKNSINKVTFNEQGVATVKLVGGQHVTISGLPRGYTYAVSEDTPANFIASSSSTSGTIGADLSSVKITNTRRAVPTGSLTVSKTVNSTVETDKTNESFSFVVKVYEPGKDHADANVDESVNGTYGTGDSAIVFTNGVSAAFTLKNGESRIITELPEGVGYEVLENLSETQSGLFTMTSEGNSGTISSTTPSTAAFTNTRKTTTVTVKKVFSGVNALPENFVIVITTSLGTTEHKVSNAITDDTSQDPAGSAGNPYTWTIENVPVGTTFSMTESNIQIPNTILAVNGDSISSNTSEVTLNNLPVSATASDNVFIFTNTYTPLGQIEISKWVVSDVTSDTSTNTDLNTKFPITVTILKEDGTTDTSFNGDYGALTFTNGEANYSVHNENTIYIRNLPVGTKYKVEETANELFNSEIKIKDTVTTTGIGTVQAADADNKVTITNTRKTGKLSLSKKVVNTTDENDLKKEFEFTIQLGDNGITKSYGAVKTDSENKDTEVNVTFTNGKATVTLKDSEKLTISGLPVGIEYTVDETQGDGFEFIPQGTNATGTISSTVEAHFTNKRKTRDILVDKRDITTGDELEGAVITIYEGDVSGDKNPADDTKIESWTSSDKEAHAIKDLEYGKIYTLRENTAPIGYDVTADTVFRINMDGTIEILGTGTIDNKDGKEIIVINDGLMKTDIELCKVSEQDPTKKLPDSTYVLYRVRGTAKVEIARAVTDARGIIRFKDVEAGGEYIITEVEAPDGYYVSEKSIKIRVEVVKNGDGGVSVVLKAVDMGDGSNGKSTAYIDTVTGAVTWLEPEIICSVLKVDEDGKALAGAALEIRKGSADGDVIDSWTSTTDARIVEAGLLVCGETYYLVEKSAPEGYDKAEPVKFTIEETMAAGEDKTVEVVMTDKKTETTTETTTETKTETTSETTTETTTETKTETVTETTTTTDKVTETNTENTDTVVKTSDDTPVSNMVVLIFVSLAGIVFFGSKKRKNNMS